MGLREARSRAERKDCRIRAGKESAFEDVIGAWRKTVDVRQLLCAFFVARAILSLFRAQRDVAEEENDVSVFEGQ